MKTNLHARFSFATVVLLLLTTSMWAQTMPKLTGPIDPFTGLPATLGNGITTGQVYTTDANMKGYKWFVSSAGTIALGAGTNSITVTWTNPGGQQSVSVSYIDNQGFQSATAVLIINYYPYPAAINPLTIPQFVDPLPHFAAGLRINAKSINNLTIKAQIVQQVALSTGTVLQNGTIGTTPGAGLGNYAAYNISTDGGNTWGIPMWPAQTIETRVNNPLTVQYVNALSGSYDQFNILADQTLMMNGYPQNGNIYTDPYTGDIPMVVHLHGGEMPSNSDGGPTAWFMPGYSLLGPGFKYNASSVSSYPNKQEAGTLWYHPHDQGLTRINVYTGLAGFYFLRGPDEDKVQLPGWSGDGMVSEVTPAGKQATFNGSTPYLPEIEVAIQDRMFNVKGELYWPVTPTNPDIHPFWTPEFFGDVMTVNGKSWPYLSVAPRKYRFRVLDGCNARFLNMWLEVLGAGGKKVYGPSINVIGSDGAFNDAPVTLNPALGQTLFMAPGERYDVVIDFTNVAPGTVITLMNNAAAPYPTGLPVTPGLTDRIMQFVVNGTLVSPDNSALPANLRPTKPMVKLTNFAGALSAGVTPALKRQIILNEVASPGGPVQVLFNNSHFDAVTTIPGAPLEFGGPTETPVEGTTEVIQVINTTVDGHPIHIHLTQWQLVSRQQFDTKKYLAAYAAAWASKGGTSFPAGLGYPGGGGPPTNYDVPNADGAVGGNPAITPFLLGAPVPADPSERVWKDDVKSIPGTVSTFVVRYAPTAVPIVPKAPTDLLYPFDPSDGPGYVWHCHIIDHEDMDMMRPLMIQASPLRDPQITAQPQPVAACLADASTSFTVKATTLGLPIVYRWQTSTDGITWTDLIDTSPYTGSGTSVLSVNPLSLGLSGTLYRCHLTNGGDAFTNSVKLSVNNCSVSGKLMYNGSAGATGIAGVTVAVNGATSSPTNAKGAFTVSGVTSGTYPVTFSGLPLPGGVNSTDAGSIKYWIPRPISIPNVEYLAGDVDNNTLVNLADAVLVQNNFVAGTAFVKPAWVFSKAAGSGIVNPPPLTVSVNGASVTAFDILAMSTGDFNGSYNPALAGTSGVTLNSTNAVFTVAAGTQFDLPLLAGVNMNVGAVSLILNIPANLVTVMNVQIAGSSIPVTWKVNGNELRIGWNSLAAVSVNAGKPLVIITMMPTASFTPSTPPMNIGIAANSLNELADGTFTTIPAASLNVDAVSVSGTSSNSLKISAAPNPAPGLTTITYSLPLAGTVNLVLLDSYGTLKQTLVNKVPQAIGTYTVNLDMSVYATGTYYLKITLTSKTKTLTNTIALIK